MVQRRGMHRFVSTVLAGLALATTTQLRATDIPARPEPAEGLPDGLYAEVATPRGVVISELFYKKAPMTCANFVGLAEGTLGPAPRHPFYDGQKFYRVVPGFVIQGGDNVRPDVSDVGYWFPNEIVPGLHFDSVGVMSMGNEDDPNTNGSEFCFMLGPERYLDYAFPIFGHAVRGLEVLPLIQPGDPMQVRILRVGPDAQKFRVDEKMFAALVARAPRLPPAHFSDSFEYLLPADQPWRVKYNEAKLANLQLVTGGQVYVRLRDKFDPAFPGQTMQQRADDYRARMNLAHDAVLAMYFAAADQWVLAAGDHPGIKLPGYTHRTGPQPAADQIEEMKKERKRVSASVTEVINDLIAQFETT
jgi:cyclophilin family peptidyl-prolyl cis-trans isomerase